jgi:hypothetical protein
VKYLSWKRTKDGRWVGTTSTGKIYIVRRAGPRVAYLRQPSLGSEICKTVRDAKEYADELARLAGFPPVQE